jgi:FlaA1/EpsC-like NDP-sugar epimerase
MYVFLYGTFLLFNILFSVTAAWLFNKLWVNRKLYASTQSMQGKTVLITGGNAGIGYEAAKDLLQRGSI